jgi:hypothetical protein
MYLFLGCESGWKEFENACYKLYTTATTWFYARDSCLDQESHLASVHSDDEQNFIKTQITSSYDLWIGGKMGIFDLEWEDGSDLDYTHWHSGEPNYDGDCVYMESSYSMEWCDYSCTDSYNKYYVCKKDYSN